MSGRVRAVLSAATVAVLGAATALSLSAVGAGATPERHDDGAAHATDHARDPDEPIFGDLFADHHGEHGATDQEGSDAGHGS